MPQDDAQPGDRARALREAASRASEGVDSEPFDDLEIADVDPLADTVGEEFNPDAHAEAAPSSDEAFDVLFDHDIVSLDQVDPEAGQRSVAQRIRMARQAARTPGGRMVTSVPPMLVGVALAIFAGVHQTTPLFVAAGVVTPVTLIWFIVCYRQWLGHKRYAYRLLESLGEDVSEYSTHQIYRPPKVKVSGRKRSRR